MPVFLQKTIFAILIAALSVSLFYACSADLSLSISAMHEHMGHHIPAKNSPAECCYVNFSLSGINYFKDLILIAAILFLLFLITPLRDRIFYWNGHLSIIVKNRGPNFFKYFENLFALGIPNPKTW